MLRCYVVVHFEVKMSRFLAYFHDDHREHSHPICHVGVSNANEGLGR